MIRTTTYAAMVAALMAGTAYAQTAPQSQPGTAGSPAQTQPMPSQSAPAQTAPGVQNSQTAPAMKTQESVRPGTATDTRSATTMTGESSMAGKWRTSKLMGVDIYGPNNEEVGEVNEVIVSRDGKITHVAISVGGFLGIGAKDVAVPFEQVTWSDQPPASSSAARTDASRNTAANAPARPAGAPAASGTANPNAAANNNAVAPGAPGRTTAPADGMSTASLPARTGDNTRMYPNHGRITLTREQLEAAPAIKYPE